MCVYICAWNLPSKQLLNFVMLYLESLCQHKLVAAASIKMVTKFLIVFAFSSLSNTVPLQCFVSSVYYFRRCLHPNLIPYPHLGKSLITQVATTLTWTKLGASATYWQRRQIWVICGSQKIYQQRSNQRNILSSGNIAFTVSLEVFVAWL